MYVEKSGSVHHVLAALDAATATAVELGHIRLGMEAWRDRLAVVPEHVV
jgi:hypothetical protein